MNSKIRRVATVHLAVACCLTAGAASAAPGLTEPALDRGALNVLLYVIDTARADHFSLYGYERRTTPFLESLAAEGALWTDFHSSSTWTWPSVSSILTSRTVTTHKVYAQELSISPAWKTLPELLAEHGYSTTAITSNSVLTPASRMARVYETTVLTPRPDQNHTDQLVAVLEDPARRPFFVHAQPIGPHAPYVAPAPYDTLFVDDPYYGGLGDVPGISSDCIGGMKPTAVIDDIVSMDWYVAQYDGLLAYIDDQLRQVFDVLEAQGLRENTLVIVTADHGEELAGERGYYFCHEGQYDGNTRVPLLVVPPRSGAAIWSGLRGVTLGGNADHLDLMPTILQGLGIPAPGGLQGKSLLVDPRPPRRVAHDEITRSYERENLKLIHGGEALLPDAGIELYDLDADPLEELDLALSDPDLAAEMEAELLTLSRRAEQVWPADEPTGILFESDFEDPVETGAWFQLYGGGNRWEFVPEGDGANRALHGTLGSGGSPLALLIFAPLRSYSAEARVKLVAGEALFSTAAYQALLQGYTARISADRLTLTRSTLEGVTELGAADFAFGLDVWHTVRLESDGATVRVLVDGTEVVSGPEPEYGAVWGTTAFSLGAAGSEAWVDDLLVERPASVGGAR